MRKIIFFLMALLTLSACNEEKMFEMSDSDNLDENLAFSKAAETRRIANELYGRMREISKDDKNCGSFSRLMDMSTSCALLDNATDDGAGNVGRTIPGIQKYLNAGISSMTNPVVNTHPWTWYYQSIRTANTFLARVDESPLEAEEKASLKVQARFLRALYYHELFRWFGALVITESKEDPFQFDSTRRQNLAMTVEWIVNEFTDLAEPGVLPESYENPEDYGRVTRGAALAYKARTLLYAASPLHAASSGVTWEEAAEAAWEMIDYADNSLIYELYDDGTALAYRHMFVTRKNSEYILAYMRDDSNDLYNNFPNFNPWNSNKELGTAVTQWLVDSYDMKDGTEPVLGYTDEVTPLINPQSGYDEQKPYLNRDPRLDQTILHDKSTWPKVNSVPGKVDISTPESWKSGYFLVKYLDERIDHRTGGKTSMNFPMMRYAEVLLNYAEAVNEAEDTPLARTKAVVQLNRIRKRAGITTDLDAADYTQQTLRERIRKERRVELCFEEHRFFDIRRWTIAHNVMKLPAVGIALEGGKYTRKVLDSRSYNNRMNLMPVPRNEVSNCPHVWQNPGY